MISWLIKAAAKARIITHFSQNKNDLIKLYKNINLDCLKNNRIRMIFDKYQAVMI